MNAHLPKWPTRTGFAKWLKARGKKPAGTCGDAEHCALAEYCRYLNPTATFVLVDSGISLKFPNGDHDRRFSKWQENFVDRFDFDERGSNRAYEMSGNDALECLR